VWVRMGVRVRGACKRGACDEGALKNEDSSVKVCTSSV